jgi:superfamily II DNA helicase RecQ
MSEQPANCMPQKKDKNKQNGKKKSEPNVATLMQKAFDWPHTPRNFQIQATQALLAKKDIIVHAGTGFGKTAVAAGIHAVVKGKITLMISPLIALHEEQVRNIKCLTFNDLTDCRSKPSKLSSSSVPLL